MSLVRRFFSIAAAVALAMSVAAIVGSASSGSSTVSLGHGRSDYARFERVTTFHGSPMTGASATAFFSADAFIHADLPRDQMTHTGGGSAPAVAATQISDPSQATSAFGLNAVDQGSTHGFVVEPPDQGMCAGNGSVLEIVNLVMKVYSESSLKSVSQDEALETFFGQPLAFGVVRGTHLTIQGDPKCYYDSATQRWFISQLDLDLTNNTSRLFLAVSQSSSPTGNYNIYSLDNTDLQNPGCPCFGDQPLLGANQDAIFLSTNEFSINSTNFNGAVVYAVDKQALALGAPAPRVFINFVGLDLSTPDGSCYNAQGANTGICWYSIQPATAPQVSSSGSLEFALSALDFFGAGDHRVAVWAFTNTSSIHTTSPSIGVTEATLSSEEYVSPAFARQSAGPLPLQACVELNGCGLFKGPTQVPEGPIQSNDDRMNQTVFASGLLWSGLNTAVSVNGNTQAGIAYFIVQPQLSGSSLKHSIVVNQGYVATSGADVVFPSIGVTSGGNGILTFTLTGPNNFPSTGYTSLSAAGGAGPVTVALAGASPQDGFTEYQAFGTPFFRPRWGDYSAAVADGDTVFFAAEMIQYANCSFEAFHHDPTCGGTREKYANWGTSLSKITP